MKNADALKTTFTALVHAMKTDTRFSPDERVALVAIDVILDAAADTNKDQDMVVVQCLKSFCIKPENY